MHSRSSSVKSEGEGCLGEEKLLEYLIKIQSKPFVFLHWVILTIGLSKLTLILDRYLCGAREVHI